MVPPEVHDDRHRLPGMRHACAGVTAVAADLGHEAAVSGEDGVGRTVGWFGAL